MIINNNLDITITSAPLNFNSLMVIQSGIISFRYYTTKCGWLITFFRLCSDLGLEEGFKSVCSSGQCMSAEEKVKKIVGAPLQAIIAFKSSRILYQYTELPVTLLTYLESFDIKAAEVSLDAISLSSFIVRWDSFGFCLRKIALCCHDHFL